MEAVRAGGDRQYLHELIREHSLTAWQALREGRQNPLAELLCADTRIISLVSPERIRELLRADQHIGDAPERARALAWSIRQTLEQG